MSRFSADQLYTFATIIEYGTFEAAADMLGISASAVSQRIKAMEKSSGRPLLRRTNPVAPTTAGKIVLRAARHSEYILREMSVELEGSGGYRTVPIAVNADSLTTWFLPIVRTLATDDKVLCEIHREGEQHSSALLRSGEVMAAITSAPEHIPACSVHALGTVRYRVVISTDTAAAHFPNPQEPTREGLSAIPYIEFDRHDYDQSMAWELLEKQYGFTTAHRSPVLYLPSSPDYANLIYSGTGWGLLPEAQCVTQIARGELTALAREPLEFPLYLQLRDIPSPALDALSERVLEALNHGEIY